MGDNGESDDDDNNDGADGNDQEDELPAPQSGKMQGMRGNQTGSKRPAQDQDSERINKQPRSLRKSKI